eukprot:Seg1704.8 transcript_id=Seg1704.8/GoldUCD/mRNA.D3Y31 product="HEAT repeat-containing protein 1" protein_id=Seg1704.8/GoldUCD/D3Y31
MAAQQEGLNRKEKKERSITLYNGSFENTSHIPESLEVSRDGQISVIHGNGIQILQQKAGKSELSSQLQFVISSLANPTKELAYDVGIDPKQFCLQPPQFAQSYSFVLDRTLNPNKANLAYNGYIAMKWSPPRCSPDGSSILATLSVNNHVYIIGQEKYTGRSKARIDVTQQLYEHFKGNGFKIASANSSNNINGQPAENELTKNFKEYKNRQYYLAMTWLSWCPCTSVYTKVSNQGMLIRDAKNFSGQYMTVLLCCCNKLGMVLIWRIKINLASDEIAADVLHTVQFNNEFATSVVWHQNLWMSIGYIAVAFTNGCVSLCSVKTTIEDDTILCKELQMYELWAEDDQMQIGCMEWMSIDGKLYLVMTKETNIIVLHVEVDSNKLVTSHSYTIAPSTFEVPISAMCCQGKTVIAASLDGKTQYFQIGEQESHEIRNCCKSGYNCFGLQLSSEGLMLLRMHCPTSILYVQGKHSKDIEVTIHPFKTFEEAAEKISDPVQPLTLETFEFCRGMAHHCKIPKTLEDCATSVIDELCTSEQLQKKEYFSWLVKKKADKYSNADTAGKPNFDNLHRWRVKERLVLAGEMLNDGFEFESKSRFVVLLAADWLIIRSENNADFELATSVYKSLNEAESLEKVLDIWKWRISSSTEIQSTSTGQTEQNEGDSNTVTVCPPRMPARELCPICNGEIFLEDTTYGICGKNHKWRRLSLVTHFLKIFNEHEFSTEGDQTFTSFMYEIILCLLPSKQHLKTQLPILKVFMGSKIGSGNPFVDGIRTVVFQADLSELENGDLATPLAKINMHILENIALLLAKDPNNTAFIKSAIDFASSQIADSSFSCFLFGVIFRFLEKVEPANIFPLLEMFESAFRTTTDRITDIDGKSKHTKVLEKTDIEEIFCDTIAAICSRKMESRKEKDRFPKLNVFCLLLRKIIQTLPNHAEGGDQSNQLKTMLFEILATGSGRKQQHHPYVKVFRSLLQGFLKAQFPNPRSLLDFLSCIVMSPKSFKWLQDGSCTFPKVDVQVCALHIFKVCLETLNKNVQSILSFESEVLPTLIILLHHPLRVIREASLGCIQALNDADCGNIDDGLKYFLSCLISNDTEMIEDAKHILYVLEKLFKPLCKMSTDVEMLEPKQLEDLRFLTKYLSGFLLRSDIHLKLGLALITNSVVFQEFLLHLVPTIKELVTTAQTTGLTATKFQLLKLLLQKFSPVTVDIFEKCPLSLKIFKTALTLGPIKPGSNLSIQRECLKQVTTEFFSNITSASSKNQIFGALLSSAVSSGSSEVLKTVRQKLIELPIDTADIVTQFKSLNEESGEAQPKKAKRARRATHIPVVKDGSELIESPGWNKIVILLEVIQQKTNLEITEKLILAFFGMLSRCLEFNSVNQPSIEYMKQLLLSSLGKGIEEILAKRSKDILSQEKFSVEKVIECFRTSENPQTHHQALLLLGKAASLFPDLVLHNIMTIFTFMGANVLRQDDSYSFEIIKNTIEAVIPTLVTAGSSKNADSAQQMQQPRTDDIVKLVVRVFVDAVPYIPEHRRILLFEHLSTVLGAESNLYIVIAILLEKLIVQMNKKVEGDEQPTDGSSLSQDFCLILMRSFSLKEQTATMQNVLHYLSSLPDEKQEESQPKHSTRAIRSKQLAEAFVPLFDATKYSTFEIRQFKYHAIGFVSKNLSDKEFLAKASYGDNTAVEKCYLGLLEEILQFVCKIEKNSGTETSLASAKYWKVMKHKANEVMSKVQNLLSFDIFMNVTVHVMKHEDAIIRRRAMELIGEKIKIVGPLTQGQDSKLLGLASSLLALSNSESPEMPLNKQVALHTLRSLVQLLSKNYADDMKGAVPIITEIFSSQDASPQVASSALLCLGELCIALNVHLIQHLPDFMPRVLGILNDRGKDVLLASGLTALRQIVESLSKFMSPYLVKILQILTWSQLSVCTEASKTSSTLRGQVKSNVTSLRDEISKKITPRVLHPALDACFDQIVQSKKHSTSSLMEITQIAIESMPRDSIKTNHSKILSLFLKAFDIRTLNSDKSEPELKNIEGSIITAFCSLVMKLSENIFRPMFIKILSWSANEEKPDRLLTFYRLCGSIAEKLKGLFLLFAGQILKPCAELIARSNPTEDGSEARWSGTEWKSNLLLIYIFNCLQKCFINDATGFLSKERFEYLFTPLVDQLENEMGSNAEYNERVVDHLIPCLSSFAVAVNDESCWKTLNYQVLLKTRSQSAQVRLASLKLLEAVHKQIGESYLILLPETIPFLAELMEDESFEVEKQCQHVISQMEEILGESLQKYF